MGNIIKIVLGVLAFPVLITVVVLIFGWISKKSEKYVKKEHESSVKNKLEVVFVFAVLTVIVVGIFLSNL
jgi:uncharacterized membrane protein